MSESTKVPYSIRLDPIVANKIIEIALEGNLSLWVRTAIDEKFQRDLPKIKKES